MLRASVTLSTSAYDVLWHHHKLGDKPNALHTPSPGATHEERAVLERQAWDELQQNGLIHRGRIDEDLLDVLTLLARPTAEIYGWINRAHERHYSVLVAACGQDAVLAVLVDQILHLHPVRSTGLAGAVVAALPTVPPARGRSLTLPTEHLTLQRAAPDDWLVEVRPGDDEATSHARTVLALPRTNAGQLHVAARDRYGHRHRAAHPLTVLDTPDGRWMTQLRPGSDGRPWLVLTPADHRLLAARLNEMRAALNERA
ncbi:hypothetical protein GCM10012275_62550 [Longimycelium tulufanense]|uniref:EspG family protein n=1 Tax=Longimycelium tulufanense TaxID=907463 RepID=A0A8J3CIS7_9PSEU|nr:ESX secretion-associated protein EspG [Longimycelium tulufanense]GGM83408.1 hypothetical protein GCM10012275_62550 [Longimycelium tulufanense]